MNISEAGQRTGLPAKTIRYYEDIGLVRPLRRANGYRDYGEEDLQRLAFPKRSRALGFTIQECRRLLSLHDDSARSSAEVKRLALEHIAEIEAKIAELKGMRATLNALVARCHGDERPDCAILQTLSGAAVP